MATPILGITDIVESQNDKEVTANEAHSKLEAAMLDLHTQSCAGGVNVTIATADAVGHQFFSLTGLITANIDVIVPVSGGGISRAKTYIVRNETTGAFAITFKVSGGTGVVLPRTGWQLVRSNGTNIVAITDLAYIAQQFHGKAGAAFAANELCFLHVFTRGASTPVDMEGSNAVLDVAATAQTDFVVYKNAASIGALRFAAAGTVGTWVPTIAAQTFVRGDRLRILAPAGADATAADLAVTIRAEPA